MSETEKEIQGIAGCRAERTMMQAARVGWEDVLVWLDRAEERLGNAWLVEILWLAYLYGLVSYGMGWDGNNNTYS